MSARDGTADGRFGPETGALETMLGTPKCFRTFPRYYEGRTMSSFDRSRELRRMAAECLAAAEPTFDAGVRASLVRMAQRYLDLAERSEYDECNEALRLRTVEAAIG